MPSRDEVPCWSIKALKWIKYYCEWRPVQARVHRSSSRESLLNRYVLFKRGYIDRRVVSPYWTVILCSSEGISTIESWVPIEPLCFVQARVYRPLSRESLLNYYTTGTKKRKTLLGRAPPVQARVNQPRVVSPYWTEILSCTWWLLLLLDFLV